MSSNITHAARLTVLKHLAAGKNAELVATIMKLSRFEVIDIASEYGYPDVAKMAHAVETITRDIENADRDALASRPLAVPENSTPRPAAMPERSHPSAARPAARAPVPAPGAPVAATAEGNPQVLIEPDELRAVINAGKQSKSKRVQALTDRILDDLARLKTAIQLEQAETEAARRKAEQKAAAARARAAEREALQQKKTELEAELAAVKAKLRGSKTAPAQPATGSSGGTAAPVGSNPGTEIPAKEIRAWAREIGLDIPSAGRVPQKVRAAYVEAHASEQAA